uniref:Cilia- and flagella-associated protein 206 n=1 Tax=Sparus aurata TaxID=8175 RepID=A0A671TZ71_SPAAU
MSRAQAESVIKKIIREVVQRCAQRGQPVSDTLVAFMVKAVVLDPRNGFNDDRTLTKQDIQQLEELCLDQLMETCSPSLDTIKMQVYFDMNYTSRREFLEDIHQVVESNLSTVSREITDSRVKTREELDALYCKMVSYILLRSGMGSPTDVSTMQEATAALQSVFPQTELGSFMVLLKRDKEQQLRELTMIVTGIRLFNKANDKREEKTDLYKLIPAVHSEALRVTSTGLEEDLSLSQSLAQKYTAVLEKLTDPDSQCEECDVPILRLKQALYNVRQHEAFLSMLLPAFKALSQFWIGLQDEVELLNILNNIRLNLQPFTASQAKLFSEAYLDGLLGTSEVKTDEQRMVESSDERIVPAEMKTQEWLLPETACFNRIPLQYNGICGYTLVNRDGLLLPGNPHVGVLKHKEKFYVFSSKEAALKFASCPDTFIAEVAKKVKRSPELIQLLKLYQQFPSLSPYSEMQPGEILLVKPIKCESGTQTDLHPVETKIVKSYEWNEWGLRRKAVKRTDLCTKVTHSVQTDLSHMRRENVTQTWLSKNTTCQSKRDGESHVPKPQTFLAGLRGQRDANMIKANLTRSVDE